MNPYKTFNGIVQRIRTDNLKIYREPQKIPNSQNNLEKTEQH